MTPTVVDSGAGVAGSVTRTPSTATRRAARCASNISCETPAARKRSSTVTTSAPRATPAPRSPVLASGVDAGSRSATPAVSPATPTRPARHGLDHGDDHPYRRPDPPEIEHQPKPRVRCTARHCSAAGLPRGAGAPRSATTARSTPSTPAAGAAAGHPPAVRAASRAPAAAAAQDRHQDQDRDRGSRSSCTHRRSLTRSGFIDRPTSPRPRHKATVAVLRT